LCRANAGGYDGMALVCGIPHERFWELYGKLTGRPTTAGISMGLPTGRSDVGQQELGLSRDPDSNDMAVASLFANHD